jgi:hypothetical protein
VNCALSAHNTNHGELVKTSNQFIEDLEDLQTCAGEFLYKDLLKQAEDKIQMMDKFFKESDLPDAPGPRPRLS